MPKGITRARDRVAFWHQAAEEQEWEQQLLPHPEPTPTSEPPSGTTPEVAVSKSKKFLQPAKQLNSLLNQLPAPGAQGAAALPAQAHQLPSFTNKYPAFAQTYFKPQYQDMLSAHLGEENYQKLLHHMSPQHHQQLTQHTQQPAPNSKKWSVPANQLKKILDDPHTETTHVFDWLQGKGAGFAQSYLKPQYDDALKSHLGEQKYHELQQHLKTPQEEPTPKSNSLAEGTPAEQMLHDQVYGPKGSQMGVPEHNPDEPALVKGEIKYHPHFKQWLADQGGDYTKEVTNQHLDDYKKLHDEHFGQEDPGSQVYRDPVFQQWYGDQINADEGAWDEEPAHNKALLYQQYQKEDPALKQHYHEQVHGEPDQGPGGDITHDQFLDNISHTGIGKEFQDVTNSPGFKDWWDSQDPEWQHNYIQDPAQAIDDYDEWDASVNKESEPSQQQTKGPEYQLLDGINKIFPDAHLDLAGMSQDQLKKTLEDQLKYLPEHPGYEQYVPQLQALYDQHFGQGAQQPDLSTELGGGLSFLKDDFEGKSFADQMALLKNKIDTPGQLGTFNKPLAQELYNKYKSQVTTPQAHQDHAKILDAYGEPSEDFMQWFAKDNNWTWGQNPATDNQLKEFLADPDNNWTKQKVQGYLKAQQEQGSDQDHIQAIQDLLQPVHQQQQSPTTGPEVHLDPGFEEWMFANYGLHPEGIQKIVDKSGPGGQWEHNGSIQEYLDEYNEAAGDSLQWTPSQAQQQHPGPDPYAYPGASFVGVGQNFIDSLPSGFYWDDQGNKSPDGQFLPGVAAFLESQGYGPDELKALPYNSVSQPSQVGLMHAWQGLSSQERAQFAAQEQEGQQAGSSDPNQMAADWEKVIGKDHDWDFSNPEKVKSFQKQLGDQLEGVGYWGEWPPTKLKAAEQFYDKYFGEGALQQSGPESGGGMSYQDALDLVKQQYPYFDNDTNVKDLPSLKNKLNNWLSGLAGESNAQDAKKLLEQIGGDQPGESVSFGPAPLDALSPDQAQQLYDISDFTAVGQHPHYEDVDPESFASYSPEKQQQVFQQLIQDHHDAGYDETAHDLQALYDEIYGNGGASPVSPTGGPAPFDALAIAKAMQAADPHTFDDEWVHGEAAQKSPEQVKGHLESLAKGNYPPEEKQAYQGLLDKYFGSGATSTAKPDPYSYDLHQIGSEIAQGDPSGFSSNYAYDFAKLSPEQAKNALRELINDGNQGYYPAEETAHYQKVYDKYFGEGAPQQGSPQGLTTDLIKKYFPNVGDDSAENWLHQKPTPQQAIKEHIDHLNDPDYSFHNPQTAAKWQKIYDEAYGAPAATPSAPAVQQPSSFNPNQLAADFIQAYGTTQDSAYYDLFKNMGSAEEAKAKLQSLADPESGYSDSMQQAAQAMLDQHFGEGATPQAGPANQASLSAEDWKMITPGFNGWFTNMLQGETPQEQIQTLKQYAAGTHTVLGPAAAKALTEFFGEKAPYNATHAWNDWKKLYPSSKAKSTFAEEAKAKAWIEHKLSLKPGSEAAKAKKQQIQQFYNKHFGQGVAQQQGPPSPYIPGQSTPADLGLTVDKLKELGFADSMASMVVHWSADALASNMKSVEDNGGSEYTGGTEWAKLYDYLKGAGGPQQSAAPVKPDFDWATFGPEFMAANPNSNWGKGSHSEQEAEAKLKGQVEQANANFPGTDKTKALNALYQKWFPGGGNLADSSSLTPGPTPSGYKPPAGTKYYQKLLQSAGDKADMLTSNDKKTLKSHEFQQWFDKAPAAYRATYQYHPAQALDDFQDALAGGPAYSPPLSGGSWDDVALPSGQKSFDPNMLAAPTPASGQKNKLPGINNLYDYASPHYTKNPFPSTNSSTGRPDQYQPILHTDPNNPNQLEIPLGPNQHWEERGPQSLYRAYRLHFDRDPDSDRKGNVVSEYRYALGLGYHGGKLSSSMTPDEMKAQLAQEVADHAGTPEGDKLKKVYNEHFEGATPVGTATKLLRRIERIVKGTPADKNDTLTLDQSQLEDAAKQWEQWGHTPPEYRQGIEGTHDHPELAKLILELAELGREHGGKDNPGLGIHWTVNEDKGHRPPSSVGLSMNADENTMPVLMYGDWNGIGEDESRSGGANGYPNEEEITLSSGAKVRVPRLKIKLPTSRFSQPLTPAQWGHDKQMTALMANKSRTQQRAVLEGLAQNGSQPARTLLYRYFPNDTHDDSGGKFVDIMNHDGERPHLLGPHLRQASRDRLPTTPHDLDPRNPVHLAELAKSWGVAHPERYGLPLHPRERLGAIEEQIAGLDGSWEDYPSPQHTEVGPHSPSVPVRMAAFVPGDPEFHQHTRALDATLEDLFQRGQDTRHRHGIVGADQRTRWSPARLSRQRRAVDRYWDEMGAEQAARHGHAVLLGGLSGSGQTSLYSHPLLGLDDHLHLDVDQMKHIMADEGMIPSIAGYSPMESSPLAHREAAELVDRVARRAYGQRRNVVWDTTMSNHRATGDTIADLRKAGYPGVGLAVMDTAPDLARQRAEARYHADQVDFRNGSNPHGGRWVPLGVSTSHAIPTRASGLRSRPVEVFQDHQDSADNTALFNGDTTPPTLTRATGPQWGQQQSTPAPALMTAAAQSPTVRSLVQSHERGELPFEHLLASLAQAPFTSRPEARDLTEAYHHAQGPPGDNDFFWVDSAHDRRVLNDTQRQAICDAVDAHHHDKLGAIEAQIIRLAAIPEDLPPHMVKPHWLHDYDGYGQVPGEAQGHWEDFLNRLDPDEIEEFSNPAKYGWEKGENGDSGDHSQYSDAYEDAWQNHLEANGVKPSWEYDQDDDDDDDDDEDDDEDAYEPDYHDDEDYDDPHEYDEHDYTNGPPLPVSDRPVGWSTPAPWIPNDPRGRQYFPPYGLNPQSDSSARPETNDEPDHMPPEQQRLPLPGTDYRDPDTGFDHRNGIPIAWGGWDRTHQHFTPPESPEFSEWVKDKYDFDPRTDPPPDPYQKFDTPGANLGRSDWHDLGRYWQGQQPQWPHDPGMTELWRGTHLDLRQKELGWLRRSLFGDQYEGQYGTNAHSPTMSDKALAKAHPLGFDNPDIGPFVLNHLTEHGSKPNSTPGMGRHWSTDHSTAKQFALQNTGMGSNPLKLPVILQTKWKGLGEDPYRTNTSGDWPDENELTLTKGAPLNIDSVQIRHPHTQQWHEVLNPDFVKVQHPETGETHEVYGPDQSATHQASLIPRRVAANIVRKPKGILTHAERRL